LLRFLAAISVVLFHYTVVIGQKEGLNTLAFLHLGEFTKYGYLGVNLFFMISGFVILMSAQSGNVVKFVLYRFTRLYPTFWFAVCLTAICIVFFDSNLYYVEIKQILINLSMMPTIFNTPYVDSVYWTLLLTIFGMFIIAYLIHKYIEIFLSLYLRSKLSIIFLKKQVYKGDK